MNQKQYTTLNMSIYHKHRDYAQEGGKMGIKEFSVNHIENGGIENWLEINRGVSLSPANMNNVIMTLSKQDDNFTGHKAASALASCSKHYEMDLPAVEGILTQDYWSAKLSGVKRRPTLDEGLTM
jgi:hypothetical protein